LRNYKNPLRVSGFKGRPKFSKFFILHLQVSVIFCTCLW